jgi:hypothetical protein
LGEAALLCMQQAVGGFPDVEVLHRQRLRRRPKLPFCKCNRLCALGTGYRSVHKFWSYLTKFNCFCDRSVREKAWCSRKRVASDVNAARCLLVAVRASRSRTLAANQAFERMHALFAKGWKLRHTTVVGRLGAERCQPFKLWTRIPCDHGNCCIQHLNEERDAPSHS